MKVISSSKTPLANQFKKGAIQALNVAGKNIQQNEISKAIEATRVQLRALEAVEQAIKFDHKLRDLQCTIYK